MNSSWHNVSKAEPCPICGHDSWCSVSNNGAVCFCRRVESSHPARNGSGWIHRLTETPHPIVRPLGADVEPPNPAGPRFALLPEGDEQRRLCEHLGKEIGVPATALAALDIRWDRGAYAVAFPMRDGDGKITGIRYRQLKTGRKWSLRGSHDGLFLSKELPERLDEIVVLEGASDTAAALGLGLPAVGRSSCLTGAAQLRTLIGIRRVRRVTIVADNDEAKPLPGGGSWRPGLDGAKRLAAAFKVPTRIVLPPPGVKDFRDWCRDCNLTRIRFEAAAECALWKVKET